MKGYKGFAPGLVCRGKQYAENTVFEEPKAVICKVKVKANAVFSAVLPTVPRWRLPPLTAKMMVPATVCGV